MHRLLGAVFAFAGVCCLAAGCPSSGGAEVPDPSADGGASGPGRPETDAGTTGSGGSGLDPAPQADMPGAYGCDGCPDAGITEFQLDLADATKHSFSGTVTGAVGDGRFYLATAGGQSVGGVIPTDAGGGYDFTVPLFCGTQLLECVWSNDAGEYVAVVEIVTTDCVDADIRVTLTWDDLGRDYELHLVKQGGRINDDATDCTWTSCIGTSLDWGVMGDTSDNPRKDVDNTGAYGPENIFYASPEDGTYTVMVEHWGSGAAESDGQLTINVLGRPPVIVDITDLAAQHVFTAATIDWPSKTVTPVGDEFDCGGNWASGCQAAIP